MAKLIQDQAEGLRHMLGRDFLPMVSITSGRSGVGKTSAVINLAAALASAGRDVLVIDENTDANKLSAALGLLARHDLLDVIRRHKTLDEVIIPGPEGISILPAGRGRRALARLDEAEQAYLKGCFGRLANLAGVVLVDAIAGSASQLLSLSLSVHEVVVVVSPDGVSITDAYALIKRINRDYAKQQFRILVNKAGSEAEARVIFDNMANVASRYLTVSLDFMGFIPSDEKLRRSMRLCRPVVQAFPVSASAIGFRRVAESLTRFPDRGEQGGDLEAFMQSLIQSTPVDAASLTI